jgi:hypothetical protein
VQDPTVTGIEERIAAFSMIPADHGEGMQILHYTVWVEGLGYKVWGLRFGV